MQSRNLLRQELRGLEAGAELALGGGFTLSGSLLSVWGEERTPERVDPADRIPPLSGRLALAGPVGTGRLELAARFADRQDRLSPRDRVDPRIDPRGTAGFAVLDAVYALPLGRGATLQLRAENLFDRRYREHGSGLDAPGRSFGLALELGYGR
ncbi:MAG: TonB-dependent receptor [Xanthomonadales bacterium]|nr:TonB-dependent receptor [Xanthomonadales bacterium]